MKTSVERSETFAIEIGEDRFILTRESANALRSQLNEVLDPPVPNPRRNLQELYERLEPLRKEQDLTEKYRQAFPRAMLQQEPTYAEKIAAAERSSNCFGDALGSCTAKEA